MEIDILNLSLTFLRRLATPDRRHPLPCDLSRTPKTFDTKFEEEPNLAYLTVCLWSYMARHACSNFKYVPCQISQIPTKLVPFQRNRETLCKKICAHSNHSEFLLAKCSGIALHFSFSLLLGSSNSLSLDSLDSNPKIHVKIPPFTSKSS